MNHFLRRAFFVFALILLPTLCRAADTNSVQHLLYVAEPGIRDYLQYGGHGVLVFDMDTGHKFVRRIPTSGVDAQGKPINVKGICASAATKRLYVSTIKTLMCLNLITDKLLWEKAYEGGCDRMAISSDGKELYVPAFEGDHWLIVDAMTGDVLQKISLPKYGSHNTVYSIDGSRAYLAGLKSPMLTVIDTKTRDVAATVGPFGNVIRPLTINSSQTLCFVNVNALLGFEVGDLITGKVLCRVQIPGENPKPPKRHGCPSHGIALTPDDRELWVADAGNNRLCIFDATVMPPMPMAEIKLRDQPGWVSFSINGQYAYPSTGEVIDTASRKVITVLTAENGSEVQSEKLLEIDFQDGQPIRAGDQFGLGHK